MLCSFSSESTLEEKIQDAYIDVQNARMFFNRISVDADKDLYDAATYNLKSCECILNYYLKQLKGSQLKRKEEQ